MQGAEVRALRRGLGLTQAKVAAAAGVSRGAVAQVEAGRLRLSADAETRLLAALTSARAERERAERAAAVGRAVLTVLVESPDLFGKVAM